jgi:hypothetical protein
MGQITWNTDVAAPSCPGEILSDDGRSVLIQTDWDYPGVASSFGWSTAHVQRCPECRGRAVGPNVLHCQICDHASEDECCRHSGSDGTVDCPECGATVAEFIASAGEWLADHDGATADDPGYFAE